MHNLHVQEVGGGYNNKNISDDAYIASFHELWHRGCQMVPVYLFHGRVLDVPTHQAP